MTSGEFRTIPITDIWVDRTARQRTELTGVEELAESISRVGLIHPPVIERSGQLRTGETRWEACKLLGWTAIPVQYVDELDEAGLQELELEENVRRKDIPWEDECKAIAKYHALQVARDPSWTQAQTGERLGISSTNLAAKMSVAAHLEAGTERVVNAPKLSVAMGVAQRINERAKASGIVKAISAAAPGKLTLPGGITIEPPKAAPKPEAPLLLADFAEWAAAYSGPEFNLLHCDFPYGVNADKADQGQAAAMGGYADGFDVYTSLLDTLAGNMDSLVARSAHLIFWFSMDYYQFTKDRLEAMGWKVNPFPLIWHKSDNTGVLPDPKRGARRTYETAFFASRGDRLLTAKGAVANSFAHPGRDKSIHMSEKPVPMLQHFMSMVCDEYSLVLDPTCGSGNSLKAAQKLGAKQVLGLEINEEFYTRSKEAYYGTGE